jgi:hypothetical protein
LCLMSRPAAAKVLYKTPVIVFWSCRFESKELL